MKEEKEEPEFKAGAEIITFILGVAAITYMIYILVS